MRALGRTLVWMLGLAALLAALAGCSRRDDWIRTDQEFALNLNLSTNRINIGGIVEVDLEILHSADTEPVFTDPGDDDRIIVRQRSWDSRELEDGREISSVNYKLTSFELGEHRIFTDEVRFVRGDEEVGTLDIGDSLISVESLLEGADQEMRDIAACEKFPTRFPRWLPVLILIALLAALAGALIARLVRRRGPVAVCPPRPPADEVALRALSALKRKGWIEEGRSEPFYIEISRIVRTYIEDRFSLRAPEQTTEEFIREAAASDRLSADHRRLASEFLHQSDMVKFARYQPEAEMMKDAFASAERLVKETSASSADQNGEVGG